jgi:hypothetical protein
MELVEVKWLVGRETGMVEDQCDAVRRRKKKRKRGFVTAE